VSLRHRTPAGDFFGDERLEECVQQRLQLEQILSRVNDFREQRLPDDDCTVEVNYNGEGAFVCERQAESVPSNLSKGE
jgi:hypothetical protein